MLWTEQVIAGGRAAGGRPELRSTPTPAPGRPASRITHATAEHVAAALGIGAGEVAVCSTGLIGEPPPMDLLLARGDRRGRGAVRRTAAPAAADAIRTTDTVPKTGGGRAAAAWSVGGMAKGAGMLAPALATMLCVLTTDAVADAGRPRPGAAGAPPRLSFDRVDSDGCMSTNDTVLLLASGASGVSVDGRRARSRPSTQACDDLARQLVADAEGASKEVLIEVRRRRATRCRRGRGRAGRRAEQPAEVRAARRGPELGPGAVRASAPPGAAFDPLTDRRRDQRGLGLPRRRARRRSASGVDLSGRDDRRSPSTSRPATRPRRLDATT